MRNEDRKEGVHGVGVESIHDDDQEADHAGIVDHDQEVGAETGEGEGGGVILGSVGEDPDPDPEIDVGDEGQGLGPTLEGPDQGHLDQEGEEELFRTNSYTKVLVKHY